MEMPEFFSQTLWMERLLGAPEQPTSLLSHLWVCHVACVAGSLSCRPRLEREVRVTVGLATPYLGVPSQHPAASLRDSKPHPSLHLPFLGRRTVRLAAPSHLTLLEGHSPKWLGGEWGAGGKEHRVRSRPVFLGKCLPQFPSVLGREEVVCPLPKGWLK